MHLQRAENPDFTPCGEQSLRAPRYPRSISHHHVELLSNNLYSEVSESVAASANTISPAANAPFAVRAPGQRLKPLYTPEERRRRDATKWTLVQGILAPIQFAVFLISLGLVVRYLTSGDGFAVATASIVAQDAAALRDHDHRLDLGARSLRPLSVRAGVLLGRRVQHARAGAAHRLSGRAVCRDRRSRASRCCSRWPPTRPTSSTPRSSC